MGDFFDYYFEYNTNNTNYFEEVFSLIKKIFSFTWVIDQGESRLLTKLVNL